ncbi:MAG: hypothetical protein PHF84_11720, partial [bacterium]|nr:hypothetical protein [bacterium]
PEYFKKENIKDEDDFFLNLEALFKLNFRDQDRIVHMDFSRYLIILPLTLSADAQTLVKEMDFKNFTPVKSLMEVRMIGFPGEAADLPELLSLL